MKKNIISFIILLAVSLTAFAQQNKKNAILNPICRDNSVSNIYHSIIRGSFESVASAVSGYEVFDRTALDAVMQEHNLERSGAFDDAQIRQLGQFAGVDYVLVTDISAAEGYLMVIAKILNVETAKYNRALDELMEMTPPNVKSKCNALAEKMFGIDMSTGIQTGEIVYNGNRYVGQYKDGIPKGKGKMYFSDGKYSSYEGEFVDGMFLGKGKMIWQNGDIYEGVWKNNKRDGQGTLTCSDGTKYNGEWKNDQRNGVGTQMYNDGGEYFGYFLNDLPNGKGTYKKNGRTSSGKWMNGIKNGEFKEYENEDVLFWEGYYSNGKKVGEWIKWIYYGREILIVV